MAILANCQSCNKVFAKTVRDICRECYLKEEEAYEKVYRFLMKRENRQATIPEIIEATGVEEKLILKFLKENRLQASKFPNIHYPCERCQNPISEGTICANCQKEMKQELEQHEKIENLLKERKKERERIDVYYHINSRKDFNK